MRRKLVYRDGLSQTPEYYSWGGMKKRCLRSDHKSFKDYGGRGITICERWLGNDGFKNFLADMGSRPTGTTLERKDTNGNYEPNNCRWATGIEQHSNRSDNRFLTFNGQTKTAAEWARSLGVSRNLIYHRVRAGWSAERALTEGQNTNKVRPKARKGGG